MSCSQWIIARNMSIAAGAVLWCFLFVPLSDALAALSFIAENSDRTRST